MSELRDRVVLITGAGSGIGRELARQLAAEGAVIAAVDREPTGLASLTESLAGKRIATATADVTDLAGLRSAIGGLQTQLGRIDVLVASAGIGRKTTAEQFSAEEINDHIRINLMGVVNSVDAVLPGMRERRQGHLVVLSSIASYRGLPFLAGYCASKAGVNALFDSLRVELVPLGIQVTTICPGWIQTPMTAPLRLPAGDVTSVEKACNVIVAAIKRDTPFLAFPRRLVWRVRLLKYLPGPWSDWLTRKQMKAARKMIQD